MNNSARSPITLSRAAWLRLALGVLIGLAGPALRAQPSDQQNPQDPPARVARVADVVGDAWLFDDDSKEWTRLLRNQTVAEGDRVRTDDHARVSLRAGSTAVWLDERSDLVLDRLDEGSVQLQLDRGDLAVQVRSPDAANDLRVLTRQGQLRPEGEGLYRIEQLDRGTLARTWQGRLRFEPDGSSQPTWVEAGEQVEFWMAEGPRAERQRLMGDAFGDWVMAQSRYDGLSASTQRIVSPEMTGAEELDRYGSWDQAPEYGAVWFPSQVAVGWAPYRYGHWAWTRYWGWAWVDDSPWGFAPFHYGRWVQYRGRWGWTPGTYVARPVYAPALVAFVGGGGSVSFGVSIGIGGRRPPPPNVGWVPLAPREAFIPAYRHTDTYVRRLNNTRDVKPIQTPRNFGVSGAVSLPQPNNRPQAVPERRPDADMQWRSPNRGERDRGDNNNRWQGQQQQQPGRTAPQVQPQQQQQQPQRNDDRNDRGRNRDFEQRPQQQAPAAQIQAVPQAQQQQQSQQQQQDRGRREQFEQRERNNNDAERNNNDSRGRGPDRQRQPEAPQAQPQQVQQAQPQQQQRQERQERPQAQPPQAQPQPQPQQQRQQQAMPPAQPQQPKNEDKPQQRNRDDRNKQQER